MHACKNCKQGRYGQAMSVAKCGHGTSRIGMELCNGCAVKQDKCEACGISLKPAPASEDPPPHTD